MSWEAESRVMRNEREHVTNDQGLIHKVIWISELDVWRRFHEIVAERSKMEAPPEQALCRLD
jgi:hypothetical protein